MASSKQTDLKTYATEFAILIDLNTKLKNATAEMNESLASYKFTHFISTEHAPNNIKTLNSVLARFFAFHTADKSIEDLKDLNDLVSNHRELLSKAIEHAQHPSQNENRAEYRQAARDLIAIKSNLVEYDNLNSPAKGSGTYLMDKDNNVMKNGNQKIEVMLPQPNDGFDVYVGLAQKISNFINAYNKVITYTKGTGLDFNELPKAADISNMLAIAAPDSSSATEKAKDKDVSKDTVSAQDEYTMKDDEKIGLGSQKFLNIMNKNIFDQVSAAVTAEKYKCFQDVLLKLLDYNKCTVHTTDAKDLDLKCQPLKAQHEIGKENCNSHYPMITITDVAIEEAFEKAEKVEFASTNNGLMLDYSSMAEGTKDFVKAGEFISKNSTLPMLQAPIYNANATAALDTSITDFAECLGNYSLVDQQQIMGE